MLKSKITFLRRLNIAHVLRVIAILLCLAFLTACDEAMENNTQGAEASAMEQETMSCWTCSLFELAFTVVNKMTKSVIGSIANSAISLLGVCYLLWLALYLLKYIASMKEGEAQAFWKGLAVQTFFVTLGAGMLGDLARGSSSSVVSLITEPIFSGFVDTGLMIIKASGGKLPCGPGGTPDSGMICLITALQGKLNQLVGVAYLALRAGPTIFIMLVGAGIYVVSLYMMVYFPILLLDCIFRYCIVIAMLPLSIVAYCFSSTRDIAAKTAKLLVEIGLAIVGMCVFIAVVVEVIDLYVKEYLLFVKKPYELLNDPSSFEEAMTGPGITGMIYIIIFLLTFAGLILDLMSKFSCAAGGLGKVAGRTFHEAKGAAKGAAKLGGKAAKFAVNRGMRKLDKSAKNTKEALEKKKASGQALTDKEQKQLNAANDHLMDRGFLARDKDGHLSQDKGANLHKTAAYDKLGNKGLRNFVRGLSEDWNSPVTRNPARHDHQHANKVTDGYEGKVE